MKARRKFLIILLVISILIVLASILLLKTKRPPRKPGREVVKHFSFSGAQDLDAWEDKLLASNRTDYSVGREEGADYIKAASEDSASALFYQHNLYPELRPFVSWDWKAVKFPARQQEETLDTKEEFDFVAQFYVIFSARFFLNTKAIQYVWTEKLPPGTVSDSPYTKNVKILVLESGLSEEWKHEERNIEEDFRNLFGEELEKNVAAVALMTDSDSTGTDALAYFGNITLGYLGADLSRRKRPIKKKYVRSKRFPFRKIAVEPPKAVEPPIAVEPPKVVEPPKAVEPPKVIEPPIAAEPPMAAEPPKEAEPIKEVEQTPPEKEDVLMEQTPPEKEDVLTGQTKEENN